MNTITEQLHQMFEAVVAQCLDAIGPPEGNCRPHLRSASRNMRTIGKRDLQRAADALHVNALCQSVIDSCDSEAAFASAMPSLFEANGVLPGAGMIAIRSSQFCKWLADKAVQKGEREDFGHALAAIGDISKLALLMLRMPVGNEPAKWSPADLTTICVAPEAIAVAAKLALRWGLDAEIRWALDGAAYIAEASAEIGASAADQSPDALVSA